jgi:hypothetical protein
MNVPRGWTEAQTRYAERSSLVILYFAWRLRSPVLAASCLASVAHWRRYEEQSCRRRLDQWLALLALMRIAKERQTYGLTAAPLFVYAMNRADFVAHCAFRWLCACAAAYAVRISRRAVAAMSVAHWACAALVSTDAL